MSKKERELLDNDEFLKALSSLFEGTRSSGSSIWLTHKRLLYEDGERIMPTEESDEREYPCILRATDGKKTISTHVLSSNLHTFHAAYGSLLKSSFQNLRKRDKKKEKARAEELALKKKKMLEGIQVTGPKRGKGRRKRTRLQKAAEKLEEKKRKFLEREEKEKQANFAK